MMHFRSKSIADSVVERITEIAEHIRGDGPLPPPRGAAVVQLNRQENGDLMVTKTFENGETELLTISAQQPSRTEPPEGIVQIGGDQSALQEAAQQPVPGEGDDIVQAAALGGDSLNALLS